MSASCSFVEHGLGAQVAIGDAQRPEALGAELLESLFDLRHAPGQVHRSAARPLRRSCRPPARSASAPLVTIRRCPSPLDQNAQSLADEVVRHFVELPLAAEVAGPSARMASSIGLAYPV